MVSTTIDGKRHAHFVLAAVFVIVGAGCAQNKSMMGSGPKGQFGNGQETLDYVEKLGFTADTAYIGNYSGVNLMFLPREHAQGINWQSDLRSGAAGDVVAQVMNISTTTFTDGGFTLAPNEVAYAWVGEIRYNGAANRGFGIYKLNNQGFQTGEWYVYPMDKIKFCGNSATRRRPSIKNQHPGPPGDCTPIALAPSSESNRLASFGASVAYAANVRAASSLFALGKLWISCAGGCCQVSPD